VVECLKILHQKVSGGSEDFSAFYLSNFEKYGTPVTLDVFDQINELKVPFAEIASRISVIYIWAPTDIVSRDGLNRVAMLMDKVPESSVYCVAINSNKESLEKSMGNFDARINWLFTEIPVIGDLDLAHLPLILVTDGKRAIKFQHRNLSDDTIDLISNEVKKLVELTH
jgi:hypothetical protein